MGLKLIDLLSESSFNEKMGSLIRTLINRRSSYHVTVDEMKADTSLCSVGNVKDTWVLCNE